jgi:hypothetical protein
MPAILTVDSGQNGSFAFTLQQIVSGNRKCDTTLKADLPQIPDFNNGGVEADRNSPSAQITHLAVCLDYWFFQGYLNRNDGGLKSALEKGISYEKGTNTCVLYGTQNPPGGDPYVCSFMGAGEGTGDATPNTIRTFVLKSANKFLGRGVRITDAPKANLDKFYAAVGQQYLQWLDGGMCQRFNQVRDVNEIWYRMLNLSLSAGFNTSDQNQDISRLYVNEDNGFTQPYAMYNGDECFSQNQLGSYTALPGVPGFIEP